MLKKIIFVAIGFVFGIVSFISVDYISSRPKLASETPNQDVVCEVGESCSSGTSFYGVGVGDTVKNYELTNFNDEKTNLYDLMSGYENIVIALEADWCGDCHRQDDKMLQEGAIPSNTLLITVLTNFSSKSDETKVATKESATKYYNETLSKTPNKNNIFFYDEGNQLWDEFDAKGTPTNIVLDNQGKIKSVSLEIDADKLMIPNTQTKPYTLESIK